MMSDADTDMFCQLPTSPSSCNYFNCVLLLL